AGGRRDARGESARRLLAPLQERRSAGRERAGHHRRDAPVARGARDDPLPPPGRRGPGGLAREGRVACRCKGRRRAVPGLRRRRAGRTRPQPLWTGAFVQPRNTKVFSNFADSRSYRYNGKQLDTAVHLGFDLASLKQSPVPAANSGVVVFAGPLTIYGNAVVL